MEIELWEHARIRVNQRKFNCGTDHGIVHLIANTSSTRIVRASCRRYPDDSLASPRSCGSHRVVLVQRLGSFSLGKRLRPSESRH